MIVAFKNIISSKLMIYMSLGLMLFVIGSKLLEYHYQTIIYYQVFPDPTRRATFFATYEVFANLAWLFIQLFLTSRLLVKWSVGASNVLYPVLSAIAALALFIYFYGNSQGLLANSVIVMLSLGIFTQFINQEMRGALRTPANNLLFNAISPNQWGNNKAFLNGIVFPLATLIAGTFLMTITGAESLIAQIDWGFSVEQLYYLLPLIALIVSILGIFIALPQWSQYEKDMQKRLEDEFVKKILGHQLNVKGGIKEIRQVIHQKLNSSNTYDVIAALDMIRILKSDLFLNQVGNLLINKKTQDFKVKKHCLQTLAALSRSNSNLIYLLEALGTEEDAQVLSLIIKDLTKFKSVNFNHLIEKRLTHPAPLVCVEACLYLHKHQKYRRKQLIEKKIMARFNKAELSQNMPLFLYALGELRLSHYSDTVLPFLESDNPKVRLAALT
ncbi:transporter, partial [Candidatus Thiomargarita nelsonii]